MLTDRLALYAVEHTARLRLHLNAFKSVRILIDLPTFIGSVCRAIIGP